MEFRQLGWSELNVSEICLGSWLTYGVAVDQQRARACVHQAFDQGINFIDTANIYGKGSAETALGEILKGVPRDSYILATKLYFPMTEHDFGLSKAQIHKQIDGSLKRLGTDYVDLYQCHRYDDETPLEETLEGLTEVVTAGKARYVGFSEWTAPQIEDAIKLPDTCRFVSSQPQYSMLWRVPEAEVMPVCAANEISQIVWCPLAQGVLSGKYSPGQPPPTDSRLNNDSMNQFMDRYRDDKLLQAVQELRPIADSQGLTMSQLALAWILRQENVASAIIGASRPEQVIENAAASGRKIDAEVIDEIDAVLAEVIQT